MTTSTLTVAEFVTARLDEDEAAARAAIDPRRPGTHWQQEDLEALDGFGASLRTVEEFPTTSGVGDLPAFPLGYVEVDEIYALPHIARHDPARVLAQCAAMRKIVETETRDGDCQGHPESYMPHGDYRDYGPRYCRDYDTENLRALASIWSDHPDWREEWR